MRNTDRYLGRRPSLAKAGDPEFDSFKVFFVCWFIDPSVYIYKYTIYNIKYIYNNKNIYIPITDHSQPSYQLETNKKLCRGPRLGVTVL